MNAQPDSQRDPHTDEADQEWEAGPDDSPVTPDGDDGDDGDSQGEGVDVSAQFQEPISKMHQGTWHAPHGRGVKIGAMIILTLLLLSIITMLVMAIISIVS